MFHNILLTTCWFGLGAIAGGWTYSYFQHLGMVWGLKNGRREDVTVSCFMALFGPVSFVCVFFLSGFGKHGCFKSYGDK